MPWCWQAANSDGVLPNLEAEALAAVLVGDQRWPQLEWRRMMSA